MPSRLYFFIIFSRKRIMDILVYSYLTMGVPKYNFNVATHVS